jgi:RHS repeat-associated protein
MDHLLRVETATAGELLVRFNYDEQGQVIKRVTGNNIYSAMEYDEAGRLLNHRNLKADGTFLAKYGYTYDSRGNRILEEVATPSGTTLTSFTYDDVGQLLNDGSYSYEYTSRGNREVRKLGTTVVDYYCYDKADQLVYRGPNPCDPNITNFTYDQNGNMTRNSSGIDVWDYTYDGENRLVEVKKNGSIVATFAYDARGRRTSKTANGSTTNYHYDGFSNRVLYETNPTGAVTIWYTWVGEQLVSQTVPGGPTYYYLHNGHGDVTALYDSDGTLQNQYAYDVWGKPDPANSSQPLDNAYRYAGYRWDEETGLYYLNARYYDPVLGRLLTQDTYGGTLRHPMTQHSYLYVANNPVNYYDPSGHKAVRTPSTAKFFIANYSLPGLVNCVAYDDCSLDTAKNMPSGWKKLGYVLWNAPEMIAEGGIIAIGCAYSGGDKTMLCKKDVAARQGNQTTTSSDPTKRASAGHAPTHYDDGGRKPSAPDPPQAGRVPSGRFAPV